MEEAEIDKGRDEELVADIIVEDCNIPKSFSIREAAIEKIKHNVLYSQYNISFAPF